MLRSKHCYKRVNKENISIICMNICTYSKKSKSLLNTYFVVLSVVLSISSLSRFISNSLLSVSSLSRFNSNILYICIPQFSHYKFSCLEIFDKKCDFILSVHRRCKVHVRYTWSCLALPLLGSEEISVSY